MGPNHTCLRYIILFILAAPTLLPITTTLVPVTATFLPIATYKLSSFVDFIFIVDGSYAMGVYFDHVKEFMISVLSRFDMTERNICVGIVLTDGKRVVVAELNNKLDFGDYKEAIRKMTVVGGGQPNFEDGLRWAYQSLADISDDIPQDASRFSIVFVITASYYKPLGAEIMIVNDYNFDY